MCIHYGRNLCTALCLWLATARANHVEGCSCSNNWRAEREKQRVLQIQEARALLESELARRTIEDTMGWWIKATVTRAVEEAATARTAEKVLTAAAEEGAELGVR